MGQTLVEVDQYCRGCLGSNDVNIMSQLSLPICEVAALYGSFC